MHLWGRPGWGLGTGTMPKQDDVARVVALLYDAAAGLESWPDALRAIADLAKSPSAILFTPTLPPDHGLFLGHGLDPAVFESYGAYYHAKDVWFASGQRNRLYQGGMIATGEELVPKTEFESSEWYNDFCRPIDIYHLLSNIVSPEGHPLIPMTHLSLFRPRGGADFGAAERRFLATIHPHLERALVIRARMEAADTGTHALADILHRLSTAVALVRADGHLTFANRAAEAVLAAGDGLVSHRGRLAALRHSDNAILTQTIQLASTSARSAPEQATNACTAARPSGRRPYQIIVLPVSPRMQTAPNLAPSAVVFIIDPEATPEVPPARIARLLGLTGAEARLAAALAGGTSLADYAEAAGITEGTARWTLKQALAKTGTDRQSAFVALVLKTAILRGSDR